MLAAEKPFPSKTRFPWKRRDLLLQYQSRAPSRRYPRTPIYDYEAPTTRRARGREIDPPAAAMDPGDEFPTDVLVEILLLLRPSSCRRCRLVCRRWRDAVDRWTTEMQSRPKVLVAVGESACVLDDRPAAERGRKLWRTGSDMARRYSSGMDTVGTCNGLVCLCNRMSGGAAITVANPLTGSALAARPRRPTWMTRVGTASIASRNGAVQGRARPVLLRTSLGVHARRDVLAGRRRCYGQPQEPPQTRCRHR